MYFGGKRVALVPASGNALYYAEDLLGSSRVIVQSNGTLCYDADFTPFGGERAYTATCAQNFKFEGKERDAETQNDDFGAREYSWRFGRWLSSDWSAVPVAVPYANLTNPQTLNLYAMASDDPASFADLDGHAVGPGPGQPGSDACNPVACTIDAGGGRLFEHISGDGGDSDDVPTVGAELDTDSIASARGAALMESALATGNAGPGAQNGTAPANSRTDVVLYGAGEGRPESESAEFWRMDWLAGRCSGTTCDQDKNLTITGVEKDGARPLRDILEKPKKGEAHDRISREARTIQQWWSIDGKQVQVVLGITNGKLVTTWGVQIVVHGGFVNPPTYSHALSNSPPQ